MNSVVMLSVLLYVIIVKGWNTDNANCTSFRVCSFNGGRDVPICYCDPECTAYNDCCVDFDEHLIPTTSSQKEFEMREKMTTSSCEFMLEDSLLGVKVISSCNTDHALKCHQEGNSSKLTDKIYVTGSDGLTYKNRQCAFCNGITVFQPWSLKFLFSRSPILQFRKSCRVGVFENVSKTSSFEMARHLIKLCKHSYMPPSGHKPRLCFEESKICSVPLLYNNNPFHLAKSFDQLSMTVMFNFKESDTVSGEKDLYPKEPILSSNVLNHELLMYSNWILELDQLYKLLDSIYLFLNNAVSDIRFLEPFYIKYIIVNTQEVRLNILMYGEPLTIVTLSRYRIITNWLSKVNISYQDTRTSENRSQITYTVVSTMDLTPFRYDPYSHKMAVVRYYTDRIVVDKNVDIFGRRLILYDENHVNNKGNEYPSVMCDAIRIAFTSYENTTFFENDCAVDEALKQSHGSKFYLSVKVIYCTFAMLYLMFSV